MGRKLFFVMALALSFWWVAWGGLTLASAAAAPTPTPTANPQVKCDPRYRQVGGIVSGTLGDPIDENVYCVTADLEIPRGQSLTIRARTWLVFHPGQRMIVAGQLLASGDTVFPIHFISSDAGGWEGITFLASAEDSWCAGCYVENVRPNGVGIQVGAPVNILDSLIRDVPGGTAISATVPFTLSHTRIDYVDTGVYLAGQPSQTQRISFMTIARCEKGVANRGQLLKLDNSILTECNVGVSTAGAGTTSVSYTLFHEYGQRFVTETGSRLNEGPGIFDAEPGFVNFPDDLTLRADSPAVNAADPQADYHFEYGYNGGRADLGAYGNTRLAPERPPKVEPTDFTAAVDTPLLVGKPGETVTFTVQITNSGPEGDDFVLWANVSSEGFSLNGISRSRSDSYYSRFFSLKPKEPYRLDIGVQVPTYATNGMVHVIKAQIHGQLSAFSTEFQLTTLVSAPTRIERVAHVGISPQDVFVQGNYAYLAAGKDGLRIWDVARPGAPTEAGFYAPPDNSLWVANKVVVEGRYAYVAAGQAGLRILDVSNPARPSEIGFYSALGSATDVRIAGHYAYVIWPVCYIPTCSTKLHIIDVSDPTAPVAVNVYDKLQISIVSLLSVVRE